MAKKFVQKIDEVLHGAHESAVLAVATAHKLHLASQRLERWAWDAALKGEDMLQLPEKRIKQIRQCIASLRYGYGVLDVLFGREPKEDVTDGKKRRRVRAQPQRAATRATRRKSVRRRA